MILETIRSHVIRVAVASVERTETRPDRRAGCLDGLQLAGGLPLHPETWAELLEERHAFEAGLARGKAPAETYWRYRCATAQLEWVRERLAIVWQAMGLDDGPVSARATLDVYRFLATNPPTLRRSK